MACSARSAHPDRTGVLPGAAPGSIHHGEALRVALRPAEREKEQTAKTLRTYLSMLRKSLRPDVLPAANSGGYRLGNAVTTDLELFGGLAHASDLETKLRLLAKAARSSAEWTDPVLTR